MILMRLNTFDAEREVKTAQEMLNNGSALFFTYELVAMIHPESQKVKRVYAASNLPSYDREESADRIARKFCENHVDPLDQERYLQFTNTATMTERIRNSPKQFIQAVFRMSLEKDKGGWYSVRFTEIPASSETVYLLTIQSVQHELNHWLDLFVAEHPELL